MADQEVDGITLRTLLEHMRAMEARIMMRFNDIEGRLKNLERKVSLLFIQIANIDERLDDVEVVQLPAIN